MDERMQMRLREELQQLKRGINAPKDDMYDGIVQILALIGALTVVNACMQGILWLSK